MQRWLMQIDSAAINRCTGAIVDASITVHRTLGPGLLESAYRACLAYELRKRGLFVRTELPVPLVYEGATLELGYRLDMLVEERVVVEVKAVKQLIGIHEAQLLSHLRLAGYRVGLLINFHVLRPKDGIRRVANGMPD